MDAKKVAGRAFEIVSPVVEELGYSLVDCKYANEGGRWILRLYVEKTDGSISVGDCGLISRAVDDVLDVEGAIPGRYFLEVSSPGLDRPLKKLTDFERYSGQKVKLKTKGPLNGRSNFKGILTKVDGQEILMSVDGVEYRIPIDAISKANIDY